MKKKRINLTMSENIYKQLKKQAVDENISVSQLLENLATEYLKSQKLSIPPLK